MEERTKKTVNYLNECIQQNSSQGDWSRVLYSLEGWAEYFATTEYDGMVSDYAPKLIERLEILKDYINTDRKPVEADIDVLIETFGIDLEEAKSHIKMSKSGATCFVASVAYDDPNHLDVMFLRNFRDTTLVNSSSGRAFIRWYWIWGPKLAKGVAKRPALKNISEPVLLTV